DGRRTQVEAAPERRALDLTALPLGGDLLVAGVEGGPVRHGTALLGRPRRELAVALPGGAVRLGHGAAGGRNRTLDDHLAAELGPREEEGGVRVVGELEALAALVVGEEGEAVVVHAAQQHVAGRRATLTVG